MNGKVSNALQRIQKALADELRRLSDDEALELLDELNDEVDARRAAIKENPS